MGSASQLVVGLLVCFLSSMLHTAYSPYIDKNDNLLAGICQLSLFFALVSAINLRMEGETSSATLGVLLVITLAVPPAFAILFHMGLDGSSFFLNTKTRLTHLLSRIVDGHFLRSQGAAVPSRESETTEAEPPSVLRPVSEPADAGVGALLPPDVPALPSESTGAASSSETRASLGAVAAMRAPPPKPASPPRSDDELELASAPAAMPVPTPDDVSSDGIERLPSSRSSQAYRSADERDEMRDEMGMFGSRASCDVPPTERRSGPKNAQCKQSEAESQEADNPSSGTLKARARGRARGYSLAEDPSTCYLAMGSSSHAAHKTGDARAGGENLFA